ncbi:NTP transferase domain-containing protein [Flammeovirga sp. EKP202]|uniref:nucleotidyltransferase family protein n=1 Tax=Flammeovirga sp. EKP202 TaxID=2770592 RepID=UPI00165FECC4|nr:nucleotidyltransferase family protein [Flammeovirga sp. EKP202]MBD0404875.1 nucleotidyltransferase family protein [Flammeovirga sp. EKP202]
MHRAVLLLCAGNSKRLGRPKQLLEWDGKSILEHIIHQVQPLDVPIFGVTGGYQAEIAPVLQKNNIQEFFCSEWELGMGESIRFGIQSILKQKPDTQKIMITLSDMPLVGKSHFEALWHQSETSKIVISQFQKVKGVPVVFDCSFFPALMQLSGDQGAKPLIQKHFNEVNILSSEQPFFDVDTEEDYQKLLTFSSN